MASRSRRLQRSRGTLTILMSRVGTSFLACLPRACLPRGEPLSSPRSVASSPRPCVSSSAWPSVAVSISGDVLLKKAFWHPALGRWQGRGSSRHHCTLFNWAGLPGSKLGGTLYPRKVRGWEKILFGPPTVSLIELVGRTTDGPPRA